MNRTTLAPDEPLVVIPTWLDTRIPGQSNPYDRKQPDLFTLYFTSGTDARKTDVRELRGQINNARTVELQL